ncbi:MAG: pentapeptide repeat-containing protein [Sulfuricurvum sp.]|uniref:pentapeptide repeat-containing protein n=1 Tax=Sulfuricurvum sp. TaxID=2025608 RepID=UPI003D1033AF
MEEQQNVIIVNKCSVCENECFELEDRCILHCEKNQNNDWYKLNEENQKEWDERKVNLFWKCIQNYLNNNYRNYLTNNDLLHSNFYLEKIIFPKFQEDKKYISLADNEYELGTNFYSFDEFEYPDQTKKREVNELFNKLIVTFDHCLFLDDANFQKYTFEHPLSFQECTFNSEIQLNKLNKNRISFLACTIHNLNCEDVVFEEKVNIQNCTINGKSNFYNTKFKRLADFYRTRFNEVVFERTDFDKVVVFSEAVFSLDVNFKYTKFLGYSVFRDTVIKGKLDLRNTIFYNNADANFLDITSEERKRDPFYGEPTVIQVSNRETARIIKNFYEHSNNIIEANKFYALEMQKREEELNKGIKNFDWLIFKIHGISSDHSQSPFLALLWIFNVSILYIILSNTNMWQKHNMYILPIGFSAISIVYFCTIELIEYKYKKQIFSGLFLIFLFISHFLIIQSSLTCLLNCLADKINPFSIMTTPDVITFGLLIYKTIIAYLIYQFIISVRQNTRRK